MAGRLYLMPIAGVGTKADPRAPKYKSTINGFSWTMMDFGLEPACIVWVENVDASTHSTLVAFADVVSPPAELDQNIGAGSIATVRAAIEALNVPANWAQATDTYREVIRIICWFFQIWQRHHGMGNARVLTGGVTLDTAFNTLSVGVRNALIATAQSFNFDTSSLAGTSTIRQILKALADQVRDRPIMIGIAI